MVVDISNTILGSLKRINLISGKGGTGRTTLAASIARASAKEGKKTLLIEIEDDSGWDSALARNFGLKHFQIEPERLDSNLYGLCLSAETGQEKFLTSFLKVNALSQMIMGNQGVKWFLEGAPAFREMGYFYHLLLQLREDYDRIIMDLPATGHFIGLARLPNLLLKMIPFGPIADRMKEGQRYLYDEDSTSVFIVTLPQTLPVSEAIELKAEITKESLPLGGFILNRAPFNPFTEAEEQILFSLSQKSKTQNLMVEIERIRRFREARNRLQDEMKSVSASRLFVAPEVFQPESEAEFGYRIRVQS
jgi:arsenite-transporting ATPase